MALPGDVTTTTVTFGPYTDAAGAIALVGVAGKLYPVNPSNNKRVRVVHIASGQVVVPEDVKVTIAADGTASAGPIPHTGQATLSPTGFAWRMEWDIATSSRSVSPGNLTFVAPSGATTDFDLLVPAATVPAVAISQPTVATVNGKTGAVVLTSTDVGAQPAATLGADVAANATVRAAFVPPAIAPRIPRPRPAKLKPLSLFQAGHGWTASTGTWTLNDTTRPIIGTQHLSVTTSTRGTIAAADKTITATNLTGKQVALLLWVSDSTLLESVQVYIGDSTLANNKHWLMAVGSLSDWTSTVRSGAWMWLYTTDATSSVDGTGDLSAATRLRLRVTPRTEGVPVTVSVQELAVFDKPTVYPNGVLTFTFDDSDTTQTKAEAILAAQGFRASMYTIVDRIDQAGSLTMADLVRQHDTLGWEICGHAYSSTNHDAKYPNLSDAVVEDDMRRSKEWLVTNGFRGADHFAWPGGQDSASTAAIARKYWATGRGLCVGGGAIRNEVMSPEAGDMPLRMRAQTPDSATAPATTTALIDKAYTAGGWLILGYHQLVDTISTPTTVKYLTTDFQTVVNYAATKGIAVAGLSEVLRTSGVI